MTSTASPSTRAVAPMPVAALLGAIVSVQVGAAFAKSLFPLVGAQGTTTLRLVFGALLLAVALRPWRMWPSRTTWPWVLAFGVTLCAMNSLFYASLATIPLGVAVALEFSGPLLVATLTSRRAVDFAFVALALVGVLLLSPLIRSSVAIDAGGALLALAAGGCWALYIVLAPRAGAELGTLASAYGTAIAAVLALPLGFASAGEALLQPSIVTGALLVGLFSSAVPFFLEMVALTRMPARVYGTLTCLEPAMGALIGFLYLRENLSLAQCLGVAAVIAAAFGTAMTSRPPVPSPE